MSKYGLILLLVANALGVLAFHYHGQYTVARQENKSLSTAVQERDGTITALKNAASADRRATDEQLKIEQQKRAKADAENKELRKALAASDCDRQRMPDDVINILRK